MWSSSSCHCLCQGNHFDAHILEAVQIIKLQVYISALYAPSICHSYLYDAYVSCFKLRSLNAVATGNCIIIK